MIRCFDECLLQHLRWNAVEFPTAPLPEVVEIGGFRFALPEFFRFDGGGHAVLQRPHDAALILAVDDGPLRRHQRGANHHAARRIERGSYFQRAVGRNFEFLFRPAAVIAGKEHSQPSGDAFAAVKDAEIKFHRLARRIECIIPAATAGDDCPGIVAGRKGFFQLDAAEIRRAADVFQTECEFRLADVRWNIQRAGAACPVAASVDG